MILWFKNPPTNQQNPTTGMKHSCNNKCCGQFLSSWQNLAGPGLSCCMRWIKLLPGAKHHGCRGEGVPWHAQWITSGWRRESQGWCGSVSHHTFYQTGWPLSEIKGTGGWGFLQLLCRGCCQSSLKTRGPCAAASCRHCTGWGKAHRKSSVTNRTWSFHFRR